MIGVVEAVFKPRPAALALAVGLVSLCVFMPAVGYDFVNWDDDKYVYENPVVLGGLTAAGVRAAFRDTFVANWAPLTILSYQFDASAWGTAPWGFHLTNVLLHALASTCLCLFLGRATGIVWRSTIVALLFAVHPLRVESVAWVSERKDVLNVLFLTLTLLAYEWYCRRPRWGRFVVVWIGMLIGLLCKTTTVTLPLLLLFVDAWPLQRIRVTQSARGLPAVSARPRYPLQSWKASLIEKVPLCLLSIVFVAITIATQARSHAMDAGDAFPFMQSRLPNAAYATLWYAWKTVVPTGLCAFHPHSGGRMSGVSLVACAAGLLAGIGLAVWAARRQPAITWGLAWFAVSLLPVLGLIQVGSHGMADRFTYIPHIGLLVACVWGAADLHRRLGGAAGSAAALAATVVGASVVLTMRQLPTWHDTDSMWRHAIHCHSDNATAHYNLGCYLEAHGRREEATAHYRRAIEAEPSYLPARNNLATLLIEAGDIDAARAHVDRALRGEPSGRAFVNLAMVLLQERRHEEALTACDRALAIDPNSAGPYFVRGRVLASLGDATGSIDAYEKALVVDAHHRQARNNLATALARTGRLDQAILHFEELAAELPEDVVVLRNLAMALEQAHSVDRAIAIWKRLLKISPNDGVALSRFAWLVATSDAIGRDDRKAALPSAEKAVTLSQGRDPTALCALAAALAQEGRLDDAVRYSRVAAELAAEAGDTRLLESINKQIATYESGQPLRLRR